MDFRSSLLMSAREHAFYMPNSIFSQILQRCPNGLMNDRDVIDKMEASPVWSFHLTKLLLTKLSLTSATALAHVH